jgi:putative endonuclease
VIKIRDKKMHYVYFLKLSNSNTYTGFTSDLKRRYQEHTNGKVDSTRPYRPLTLIGYEAFILKSDAERREKFLKTTEGKRLFRQQYRDILIEKEFEKNSC